MMKKTLIILSVTAIILAALLSIGCSKSKLSGTFEGTLPCADCPGIQTFITINSDGTFHMEETYLESDVETMISDGKWVLDKDVITFTVDDYNFEYKVISDKEIKWAPDGEEITGTDLNWSLFKK
jgi:hypothetical protein